jgi:tetratricopeptide (TPR) repeat protein
MRPAPLILLLSVVLSLCACGDRTAQRMLDRAENVLNENPGEAIAVLDSISDDGLSRSQRMRHLLLLTNAQNKCDTVFRSDSIQRLLVDYYESHGTANERMLAHYLLGRAYYDMGEMPMSLNAYQLALADTTGTEKDYYLLTRIHAQISNIFFQQNLIDDQLKHIDLSVKYALLSNDSVGAILNKSQKAIAYERKGELDSALYFSQQSSMQAKACGYKELSAGILGGTVTLLVEKDSLDKAKTFMDIYEAESGFFDNNHDIAEGREIYYYTKGRYYLAKEKYDSAEFCFRKELREGLDFNNQNAASRGLALLFQKTHRPDSAAKYALYSYEMNDSVYAHMATEEVERMKAMYDYSYHKRMAEQKENEAYKNRNAAIFFGMLFLLCLLAVYIIFQHIKRYKREADERERLLLFRLAELENQLTIKEIKDVEKELFDSPLINTFRMMAKSSTEKPTLEEWSQLRSLLRDKLPSFWNKLQECKPPLRMEEVDVCLLIRLQFKAKEIANLTGMSPQSISNIRRRLLPRVFHQSEGGSKEFDRLIMKL